MYVQDPLRYAKNKKKTKATEDYPCQDYGVPEMVRQNNKNQL